MSNYKLSLFFTCTFTLCIVFIEIQCSSDDDFESNYELPTYASPSLSMTENNGTMYNRYIDTDINNCGLAALAMLYYEKNNNNPGFSSVEDTYDYLKQTYASKCYSNMPAATVFNIAKSINIGISNYAIIDYNDTIAQDTLYSIINNIADNIIILKGTPVLHVTISKSLHLNNNKIVGIHVRDWKNDEIEYSLDKIKYILH